MINIKNNSHRSLGIPGLPAVLLRPGLNEVADSRWRKARKNPVIKRWLAHGILEVQDAAGQVTVEQRSPGWYDVLVDGEPANEKGLRRDEAELMAESLA